MRKKNNKLHLVAVHHDKVYRAKPSKKFKKNWWQYLYSLFF